MAKHGQADFIIPVIRTIYDNGGRCLMSTIKDQVGNYITLTPEDLEPMPSRAKTEPCYRQIVGNLVSHKTPALFKAILDDKGDQARIYVLKLNEEGMKFAEQFQTIQHSVILDVPDMEEMLNGIENSQSEPNSNDLVDDLDSKVIDAANKDKFKRSSIAVSSLGKTINKLNNYTCQFGKLVGENHTSFVDNNGNNYVEPHHLIPMKASRDFFPRNLDRPSNIITLCPNCHYILHHGSEDEVKRVLKVLYDKYIVFLNSDDIYITFDELFNKYYKRKG